MRWLFIDNSLLTCTCGIVLIAALAVGCNHSPGDKDRLSPEFDSGLTADAGHDTGDDIPGADSGDAGEADTGPSGPPGFSLQGNITSGGGPASGGNFSLTGHITTRHSGRTCTGGGWILEYSSLQARE